MSTPTQPFTPTPGASLAGHLHMLRAKWGWFVALGIIMIVAGMVALGSIYTLAVGTLVSVLYIGAMMAVAGVAQIIQAFQVKGWGAFTFWLLDGLLYLAGGIIAFVNPSLAASVLTLLLGVSLLVGGGFRLFAALNLRPTTGWGWLAFSAVIAMLLGLEIITRWPIDTEWILGMFLGINLVFNGFASLMLGLRLKK